MSKLVIIFTTLIFITHQVSMAYPTIRTGKNIFNKEKLPQLFLSLEMPLLQTTHFQYQ